MPFLVHVSAPHLLAKERMFSTEKLFRIPYMHPALNASPAPVVSIESTVYGSPYVIFSLLTYTLPFEPSFKKMFFIPRFKSMLRASNVFSVFVIFEASSSLSETKSIPPSIFGSTYSHNSRKIGLSKVFKYDSISSDSLHLSDRRLDQSFLAFFRALQYLQRKAYHLLQDS